MLNCQGCGLTNRPYDASCTHCNRLLQDAETAGAKLKEWEALSPKLREEMERTFDRMREGTLDHLGWLQRHRLRHAVLGAIVVNVVVNGGTFFQGHWTIPVDSALGAGAALLLNRWRGGAWHGAGLFLGAGVAALFCKLPFVDGDFLIGGWLLSCFAFFLLAIAGYFLGLKLDFEHADRSVTR